MTTYWYLTRGTGVVTLVLLTLSVCLGISITRNWRLPGLPRFVTAGLHRNITLLAVLFLVLHVVTTLLDTYVFVGVAAVFVPFTSHYRPLWVGLGAVSADVLIALVATSLLRRHVGYRTWRAIHWAAYACWPLALFHALGSGTDARAGWMVVITAACIGAVALVVAARISYAPATRGRFAAVAGAAAVLLGVVSWYSTAHTHLRRVVTEQIHTTRAQFVSLPGSFAGDLHGTVNQTAANDGTVLVRIDATLLGPVHGRLRLALQGLPMDGGGVQMTASGATFRAQGSQLYQGSIVSLDGTRVGVNLDSPAGPASIVLDLRLASNGTVSGSYEGQT